MKNKKQEKISSMFGLRNQSWGGRVLAWVLIVVLTVPIVFAAPQSAFAADADTKLLLHANGTDATTTFKDYSPSGHTVTANNDVQVDTADSQFGGGAAFFDGTNDYLSVANNADFDFGSDDFTIDVWVNFDSVTGERAIASKFSGGTGWLFQISGSNLQLWHANLGGQFVQVTHSMTTGTWYHVAVVRSGSNIKFFVDGTQVGADQTANSTYNGGAAALNVGVYSSGSGDLQGHLDEIRISKGVARWTENFTAPTSEYDSGEDIAATGGTITYADGYVIHTFTSSGTFEITAGADDIEYLVVGGGGAGGTTSGGGGGGGGLLTGTVSRSTGSYTVTVGAGGTVNTSAGYGGNPGGNSVFDTVTATGGGGSRGTQNDHGGAGGSGGGGTGSGSGAYNTGGPGTEGQGFDGGDGRGSGSAYPSGGGGGAGEVGANFSGTTIAGDGGDGVQSSINGTATYYGGGGGGGVYYNNTAGAGGAGGGGAGGKNGAAGTAGTANTGGGGGGGGSNGTNHPAGGAGGSGIVIVRYEDPRTFEATGGTIIEKDGYIIHTFTSSDTFEVTQGSANVEYLVVAGGGGGGGTSVNDRVGGGGGAGGLLTDTKPAMGPGSYTVTVGAGGTGGANAATNGTNGGNSVFDDVTATGGGRGGGGATANGATGGSGGGGEGVAGNGAAGTVGQGNAGGNGAKTPNYGGGGGGGAGAAGSNGTTSVGGAGGAGTVSSITGSSVTYAGGGGGGTYPSGSNSAAGGAGGGGAGGAPGNPGVAGTDGLGGGGGGAGTTVAAGAAGGDGGDGIVIVRYLNPEPTRTIRLVGVVRLINVRLR